jgi:ABC exporter DevB family membrane fusion protein
MALIVGLESRSNHLASSPRDPATPAKAVSGIFAPGRVEGATREVELRPALMGRVAKIAVKEGNWVTKGDLLLSTVQSQYVAAVHLAEAQLRAAEAQHGRLLTGSHEEERRHAAANLEAKLAQLQQAQRTWQRFSQLSAGGAVTQQDTDLRQSELHVLEAEVAAAEARVRLLNAAPRPDELDIARANIEAARARLEMAQSRLADTELRAPLTGQVLRIDVHEGEIVGPDSPQPAVTMADTRQLRVRAFVDEYDAMAIRPGAAATISVDGLADREFRGRVAEISPTMRRKQLRTYQPEERLDTDTREVVIALEAGIDLVMGLRVDVLIELPHELPQQTGKLVPPLAP